MGGPVEGASFVIDDLGLEATGHLGIPASAIHVSVTPFGSGGPRAHWRGGELVASAMGGALRVTGEPGRPPVKEAGDACTFHADMAAAAGAMAAHYARGTHGKGQHVDMSVQQVAFSRNTNGVLVWQFDRRKLAPRRRQARLRQGQGPGDLAAGRRLVLPFADDRAPGRAGQPAPGRLDGRGLADNPLRGTDWLSLQPLDPAGGNARRSGKRR